MSTIVAIAENFGFGPTGRLLSILKEFKKDHQIIYIGSGLSLALARKEGFSKYHELNSLAESFYDQAARIIKNADLLISSQDRPSVDLAQTFKIPTVLIDGLFWRWRSLPQYLLDVDCYIKVNSCLEDNISKLLSEKIKNLVSVGPIVDTKFKAKASFPLASNLLISFGGMDALSWYKSDVLFPYVKEIIKIIFEQPEIVEFDKITITGNQSTTSFLKKTFPKTPFKSIYFGSLSHDEFLKHLSQSKLIITTPGGQTAMEAFAYEVPAIFLPATNDTQYLWQKSFKNEGCDLTSISLDQYFKSIPVRKLKPKKSLGMVHSQLTALLQNDQLRVDLTADLASSISNYSKLDLQRKQQSRYFRQIGDNGLLEATASINSTIKKKS